MSSTSKKIWYQVIGREEVLWDHLTEREAIDKVDIYSTPERPLDLKRIKA